ncbi:MAG: UDP- glucuronosyltransferase [Pimelobacter sp.]|nr:UDP- glucuronosyltransferase [Pimelobacter sp.]
MTRLAERAGNSDALVRALEREAELEPPPERLGEIGLELCDLYRRRDELESARAWARRAAETAAPDHGVLERLARLQEDLGCEDELCQTLDRLEPDVVVNFYEGLMGLHAVLRGTDAPVVAVGHQFMTDHPEYPLLPGQPLQRVAMQGYTALVGSGAASRLALSFYDAPDHGATRVTPPLLRPQLAALADVPCDGSILVYLMEPAMAPQLVAWSDRHPEVRVHTFAAMAPHAHSPSLTFHGLSGTAFLQRMAAARGVVCTAGFETVSEAMWLGTPALMVPTPGHYEQRCNAVDAEAVGAGVRSAVLDLDTLLALLDGPAPDPTSFRAWVAKAEARAVGAIEEAAGRSPVGGDGAGDGQRTADVPTVRPARRSGV